MSCAQKKQKTRRKKTVIPLRRHIVSFHFVSIWIFFFVGVLATRATSVCYTFASYGAHTHENTYTYTHTSALMFAFQRRRRRRTLRTHSNNKRRFIFFTFLITSSCVVCLHILFFFCIFILFISFLLLHVISSFGSVAALCGYCLPCVKQWVFFFASVNVCVYLCIECKQTLHTHAFELMCLCEHRVVCMLNASYTLHFDSIGVRDRIVCSFVVYSLAWIFISISCKISYFYSNGISISRVSFCLHFI